MSQDVYQKLREFLHEMPGGYPDQDPEKALYTGTGRIDHAIKR